MHSKLALFYQIIFRDKLLGTLKVEPWPAGLEARMLPLCYAYLLLSNH
jgi:hypothetical protein